MEVMRMVSSNPGRQEALGQSEPFLDFQERLSQVAPVERPVLLVGERGTGKELAAARLHFLSGRWQKPFVTLNCATLSPSLIEAELFGYEKGAFTGAETRREGRFAAADGGTLFLDEIGSIPMVAQEKILRVVEYGSFERVGGALAIEVDVRIVGATNVDLSQLAARGGFKSDLLDRLSFEVLFLPPLRYRQEDIGLLANHFATRMAFELGRPTIPRFSAAAIVALERYDWPGNVRELKNVVERAVYRAEGEEITAIIFDPFISPYAPRETTLSAEMATDKPRQQTTQVALTGTLNDTLAAVELQLLAEALAKSRNNQRKAAAYLGLTYHQLRGKLRKYGQLPLTEKTDD
jgi:psp operon transcriptional activator